MAGNDKEMEKYLETLRKAAVEKGASKLSKKQNMSMDEARALLEAKSEEMRLAKTIADPKAMQPTPEYDEGSTGQYLVQESIELPPRS